ncbi:MAG: hypothetical protein NTU81_01825 [Candidatus Nomurabacteria bacterium]|nr:hypothetical protein [Candidatus Nomurabacteria bacterium]
MKQKEKKIKNIYKNTTHYILANSYFMFLPAIILGVYFDTFLNKKIFAEGFHQSFGFILLMVGSVIIYWAQSVSSNYKTRIHKKEGSSDFEFGPYKYLRSPTHFGIGIMILGFSFIINSLFSVIFTIIAYTISKFFFLKKEELLLEKKYGEIYREYKKKVKNWI